MKLELTPYKGGLRAPPGLNFLRCICGNLGFFVVMGSLRDGGVRSPIQKIACTECRECIDVYAKE